MNSEQLQDWLTELHNNLTTTVKTGSRYNEDSSYEHRRMLKTHIPNSKILINYLICNYEQTELVQPLIAQLLALYYRLGVARYFMVQTLPSLIYIYLIGLQKGQDQIVSIFETLFIAIYNEEILAEGPGAANYNKRVDQVRIPSVRFPSVYHDPNKLNTYPEVSELRLNSSTAILCSVQVGPYPAVESVVGENRFLVLTRLLKLINSCLPHLALDVVCVPFCEMMMNIASSGFDFTESSLRQEILSDVTTNDAYPDLFEKPRIFAPSYFYIEGLTVINFCIFNGFANIGLRSLDGIHQRAMFDIAADVLLVTNSMRDLLIQEDACTLIREVEQRS